MVNPWMSTNSKHPRDHKSAPLCGGWPEDVSKPIWKWTTESDTTLCVWYADAHHPSSNGELYRFPRYVETTPVVGLTPTLGDIEFVCSVITTGCEGKKDMAQCKLRGSDVSMTTTKSEQARATGPSTVFTCTPNGVHYNGERDQRGTHTPRRRDGSETQTYAECHKQERGTKRSHGTIDDGGDACQVT